MLANWDASFQTLISDSVEGGYTNNPNDPGGPTNHGVTQAVWESYVGHPVSIADMQALTVAQVEPLYKALYWDKVQGDLLPAGVDYAVFDCAVNSGYKRAAKILQGCVGALQDGFIGDVTLALVNAENVSHLIIDYINARQAFLQTLPMWETFKNGWCERLAFVQRFCLQLAASAAVPASAPAELQTQA
jgi:lysozyme family protein